MFAFAFRMFKAFTSPVLTPLFVLVPIIIIGLNVTGVAYLNPDALLASNVLFLAHLSLRLLRYLVLLGRPIRYGAEGRRRGTETETTLAVEEARGRLVEAGYAVDASGGYAEKPDAGYWGAIALHVGLILLILTGTNDYFRQLEVNLTLGVGSPAKLYEEEWEGQYSTGYLSKPGEVKYQVRVVNQIFRSQEWPDGASEIEILSPEGRSVSRGVIAPGSPMRLGELDFRMRRFAFSIWTVVIKDNVLLFSRWIGALPMPEAVDGFTHYGKARARRTPIAVEGWFDPVETRFRTRVTDGDEEVADVVLGMGYEHKKEAGSYLIKHEGIGKWSEIQIVRRRHKGLLLLAAIIAVAGLLGRLALRPRRVWIQEQAGRGCRITATDAEMPDRLVK